MLPEEREKKVSELRAELTTIRTQVKYGGTVDNPARVRELRRAIARLLTAQNPKAPTEKAQQMPITSRNILAHEWIDLELTIKKSPDTKLEGPSGRLRDETKNTLVL